MSARISYLIKWVERGVRSGLDTVLHGMDVTTPEYTTLSVLRHRSGLSSAQLARRAFVSAQAMNQIVVALERNGWIERTPDPENGRILRAKLTRAGRAVVAACDKATAEVERTLLSRLSADEVAQLRALLEACADSLTDEPAR
jgi:DNA-binding MarR family transcriptional regulator